MLAFGRAPYESDEKLTLVGMLAGWKHTYSERWVVVPFTLSMLRVSLILAIAHPV